ncbi:MAG: bile acid:sodium symporter [Candidatus Moranbacteria bacterium]|nr:bile acid:sodium symporter [Candidatus Moranbacteria bacterium]
MIKHTQKLSNFLSRWTPILVFIIIILALFFGYFFPDKASVLEKMILPFMILMLIPMMMSIVIRELGSVARDKKIILLAVLINFVISPLAAFLWAKLFFGGLDPKFTAGWILKLTVPCSAMMVAWTGMAKGKTETALVIQVVSFILAIFFVPFWMTVLASSYVTIDAYFIIQKILLIIVLPMAIGISLREIITKRIGAKNFREEIKPFLPPLSTLGMYIVIFSVISLEARTIIANPKLIGILVISIAVVYPLLFFLSILIAKKTKIKYENAIALGYSVTAKNHGITLAVAFSAFGGLSVLPAAFTPILQILIMLAIYHSAKRIKKFIEPSFLDKLT